MDTFRDEDDKFSYQKLEQLAEEGKSLLGLTLRKTQSFQHLIEEKLSKEASSTIAVPSLPPSPPPMLQGQEKLKASNFHVQSLRVGLWESASRFPGDMVAKIYFAKKRLVWEILDSGLKKKMEIQWSDIGGIRAVFVQNQRDVLQIELNNPPAFFQEISPQPRQHTIWNAADDFTAGEAQRCRIHSLECTEGTLEKHYRRLLQSDGRLLMLSTEPFPQTGTHFFTRNDDLGINSYDLMHQNNLDLWEDCPPENSTVVDLHQSLQAATNCNFLPTMGSTNSTFSVADLQALMEDDMSDQIFPFQRQNVLPMGVINQIGHPTQIISPNHQLLPPHLQTPSGYLLHPNNNSSSLMPNQIDQSSLASMDHMVNLANPFASIDQATDILANSPFPSMDQRINSLANSVASVDQRVFPANQLDSMDEGINVAMANPMLNQVNASGVNAPWEWINPHGYYSHNVNASSNPAMSRCSRVDMLPSDYSEGSSQNWMPTE